MRLRLADGRPRVRAAIGGRTMLRWVAVVAALLAAGSTVGQTIVDKSGSSIPPKIRDEALRIISDRLKDPGSSQFRRLGYISGKNADSRVVCGQVNAKNPFGGYIGYQYFSVVWVDGSEIVDLINLEEMRNMKMDSKDPLVAAGCLP